MEKNENGTKEEKSLLLSDKHPLLHKTRQFLCQLWRKDIFHCIPTRFVTVVMCFLGISTVFALRVNLSIAILAMVEEHSELEKESRRGNVYQWSATEQGTVLASFYYGYLITQIPGGWLADRFGSKYTFGVGILMSSICTLLIPLSANVGVWCIVLVRVLAGVFEGVTFPAMNSLLSKWAVPSERSAYVSFAFSGKYVGTVLSFPLSALLSAYGFAGGWPSIFYVFGLIGIVWFVFWLFLGFDSPENHPRISKEELKCIHSNSEGATLDQSLPIPWQYMLTSPAVWAIIIAQFCGNYSFYLLHTTLPTYFRQVFAFDYELDMVKNGIFSAMPYVAKAVGVITIAGPLADVLRATCLSTTATRKLLCFIAFTIGGLLLILNAYFGTISKWLALAFVTLSTGVNCFELSSHYVNPIDIAPKYAGILMGISNSAATIAGIIAPQVAKGIASSNVGAPHNVLAREWGTVFIVAAEIYFFGAIAYVIMASGEKQWWADGVANDCTSCNRKHRSTSSSSSNVKNGSGAGRRKNSN